MIPAALTRLRHCIAAMRAHFVSPQQRIRDTYATAQRMTRVHQRAEVSAYYMRSAVASSAPAQCVHMAHLRLYSIYI